MKRSICALLLLGTVELSRAGGLLEAYDAARQHDAALAAAEAAYRAAAEKTGQAAALLKPQAAASADVTRSSMRFAGVAMPGVSMDPNGTTNDRAVSVTQSLYNRANRLRLDEARREVGAARRQLDLERQGLMARVAQRYLDVLVAAGAVRTLDAQKEAVAGQLAAARKAYEVGKISITDSNEAQARFDLVSARRIAAANQLDLARRALASLTGRDDDSLLGLAEDARLPAPPGGGLDDWTRLALRQNLRLMAQQDRLAAADIGVARSRAARLPVVDLVATASRSGGAVLTPFVVASDNSVAVQMKMPIYQGGLVGSREREALASRDKEQDDLEQLRRDVSLEAQQSWLSVQSGLAQVAALEQAVRSARTSLDSTRKALDVGLRNNNDLLNAQQAFYEAERNLDDARYALIGNEVRLLASGSALDAAALGRLNGLLRRPVALKAAP